ncbi:PIN domain nuclease of toxin-antitoxin system [Dyadobacter sp. BE34]|uniref:PIN domain nuclease of toxin-antitoxin system n=1 Tax=Dyadobacter fermentans TaxID=94254 RepID=A0ABU1R1N0_9BACT|nr:MULTISPECIES: type II toxin-antitoxin system VapC family toxin [Dyadobacter]MDR6807263.1 PIN domain nuclease of toxin-antitoxin system [Dyadobacter fermentans]MDR7045004.1 PIN domain nuclease of toxin-antitoxin system [Dyadobacter sp. BE242]MDR7199259.1 PIN domain nuclease of toxin-antitoxin system [Dyadobacter sp. BE34]MDR7217219.1 PIN domain nuclease of toxin-antitoxin system [Dyadobacter sp. BE31]MDR7265152.1 PIN domain nuclease of toxin-antitoxin system [Dyadobacter sp. BE32]
MRYLLDTHTFIWFNQGDPLLGDTIRLLIEDADNEIHISIASLWEIAIKTSLKKLPSPAPFDVLRDDLIRLNIQLLHIKFEHTALVNKLPFHHKDPFDRMIASQAICENLDLLSCDDKFDKYLSVGSQKRLW